MTPLDDLTDFWKVAHPNRLPPEPPMVKPVQFYVGGAYQGHELKYLGLVKIQVPEPRRLSMDDLNELLEPQDVEPLSGYFFLIEGYFFPPMLCTLDQLNLYRSNEGYARPIASRSLGTPRLDITPPLGIKFKFALGSLES